MPVKGYKRLQNADSRGTNMAHCKGPLAGIRVLDFSTLLPGPLATLMLTEAGAEVIKVERPDGEDMRGFQPFWAKKA